MRKVLAVMCVLAGASLMAPAAAAASACDDGVDNDGDGATDGQDSGCSPPYRLDDSEEKVWDTDATTLFDGNDVFDVPRDSVSLLVPGQLNDGEGGSLQDFSSSPPEEGFVEGPGDDISDKYGDGSFGSVETESIPSSWDVRSTGFLGLFGAQEYVDPPRDGECGNGENENGEGPQNCPNDAGMIADVTNGGEGTSEDTVSDILIGEDETKEIDTGNRIVMKEENENNVIDLRSSNPGTETYDLKENRGGPDYYISTSDKDELIELSKPNVETETITTVTSDNELQTKTAHTGVAPTNPIPNTDCAGENCTDAGTVDYCGGYGDAESTTRYDHEIVSAPDYVSDITVQHVNTQAGASGYDERGFSLSHPDKNLKVTVKRNEVEDDGTLTDYTSCPSDSTTDKFKCESGTQGGCSLSSDTTGYSLAYEEDYNPDQVTNTNSVTLKREVVTTTKSDWKDNTEEIINLDRSAAGTYVGEDYGTVHHQQNEDGDKGYFSVDRPRDDVEFGNNRAFGWSTFDLTVDSSGDFATERTDHAFNDNSNERYDPDGNNGEGDTLVAVHEGEGIVGKSDGEFGPLQSESDITVNCPNEPKEYTKCVAAVDVSLNSFDTWDSYDNPSSGAEYEVVARAGLGEGLSACKMYQELNEQGESVQCTYEDGSGPLPYGPYTDKSGEYKAKFDGPAADTTINSDNPVFAEHQISENQCVFNGTVYDEGSLKDIGAEVTLANGDQSVNQNVEEGGYNLDQEVCLDMDSDIQGEWHDLDKTQVNDYITSNGFSVSTGESVDSLIITNPDGGADSSTGVVGQGASLEDDCDPSLTCGDEGPPYFVPFYEGAVTADYNPLSSGGDVDGDGDEERQIDIQEWKNEHPLPASLSAVGGQAGPPSGIEDVSGGPPEQLDGNPPRGTQSAQEAEGVHNTVDTLEGSDHGSGTGQMGETDLDLGPLENSRIDEEDDEWGLSPNLSYVVNNRGRSFEVSGCHGQARNQGDDLDKKDREYANSYAKKTPEGGEWVNPDSTNRTVERGGKTCDLTGKDWGIAYDEFAGTTGALPEKGGSISGITFVGKGKLIPPSSGGTSLPGASTEVVCLGSGCDRSKGSSTSEDEDDTTVDDTGDTMDGTLETGKLENTGDLCIGSRCENDGHQNDGAEAFSDSNQEGDSADIIVPDIYPNEGNLCAGSGC